MKTQVCNFRSLVLVMSLLLLGFTSAYAQFAGGTGTEADPYQVATAEHLNNIRDYLTAYFVQTADIDLGVAPYNEGEGWATIGTYVGLNSPDNIAFTGFYDGNNHYITNLMINRTAADNQGLFCFTRFGEIKNLSLVNVEIHGNNTVGGLIAVIQNDCNVENCHVQGVVTGLGDEIGGLVGRTYANWYITKCSTAISVTGHSKVGGLVGYLAMSSEVNMSFSSGMVVGSGDGIGGLVGEVTASAVRNCYSRADAAGINMVGGLLGKVNGIDLYDSYSTGFASASGTDSGGLIGNCSGTPAFADCYWDMETSGHATSDGGVGKTTDDMTFPYDANTFVDWGFPSIWSEDSTGMLNDGYPYLTGTIVEDSDDVHALVPRIVISNYPNPFKANTNIAFNLPKSAFVSVTIFNLKGQQICTLVNTHFSKGEYSIQWDGKTDAGKPVPNGIYMYTLKGDGQTLTRKLTVVK